jgi:hypothetical protein
MSLAPLIHPKNYRERDVVESLVDLFPSIFPGFYVAKRSFVGRTWLPDIFGYNEDHNQFLIVEVKGSPPAGTEKYAVNQVVLYGESFWKVHPNATANLLVIGPWRSTEIIRLGVCRNRWVGVMRINDIGDGISNDAFMPNWMNNLYSYGMTAKDYA